MNGGKVTFGDDVIIGEHKVGKNKDTQIWHKRLAHASMDLIGKQLRKNLIVGLLKLNCIKDRICNACQKGK